MIRRAYIRKVEDRLARAEDRVKHLQNVEATSLGDVAGRVSKELRDLRAKAEDVRKGIRAVEAADASGWGRLKDVVDRGLEELERQVGDAIGRVRKAVEQNGLKGVGK